MKKSINNIMSKLSAFLMAVMMLMTMFPGITLADTNTAVTEARNGVLQVNVLYKDDTNTPQKIGYGSAFLINDSTIITCAHVVNLTNNQLKKVGEHFNTNKSVAELKDRISYSITATRDIQVDCTLTEMSKDMDFAILTLKKPIQQKTPLALADSDALNPTDDVYAIGFTEESSLMKTVATYTSSDAEISSGTVNKSALGKNLYSGKDTDYIMTSVELTEGNSGGPMVDKDGNVVGICEGSTGNEKDDHYFYAVSINQCKEALDLLGIQYTAAGAETEPAESETETTYETESVSVDKSALSGAISENDGKDAEAFTEDSFAAFQEKLDAAKVINNKSDATQDEVNAAAAELATAASNLVAQEAKKDNLMLILIGGIVILVILIIILAILFGGKKKKASGQVPPVQNPPVMPPVAPNPANGGFDKPYNVVPNNDAGATTVLSGGGAGETTLLSRNVNGGTLIRKNGERIMINAAEFVIGREQNRVNYCVSGNTTIGRVHAKIVVRGNAAYLVDLKATNGTFINGIKCNPLQEYPLKNGDKITLSDEEFIFQA